MELSFLLMAILVLFSHCASPLDTRHRSKRLAITFQQLKWPTTVIPYNYGAFMTTDRANLIVSAIKHIEYYTCVRFVWRTNQVDYVTFIDNRGCSSDVGRIGGQQTISIERTPYCEQKAVVVHELLHSLGFLHEHSRLDRDNYVIVNTSNIKPEKRDSFSIDTGRLSGAIAIASDFGYNYDKQSVMHYGNKAFAIDPQYDTIYSKSDQNEELSNREGLSEMDVKKVNNYFGCPDYKPPTTVPPTTTATTTKATTTTAAPTTKLSSQPTTKAATTSTPSKTQTTATTQPTQAATTTTVVPTTPCDPWVNCYRLSSARTNSVSLALSTVSIIMLILSFVAL